MMESNEPEVILPVEEDNLEDPKTDVIEDAPLIDESDDVEVEDDEDDDDFDDDEDDEDEDEDI